MKRTLFILALLFLPLVLHAQTTTVTATVTDSDGTAWANGTWAIQYHNSTPGSPTNTSTGQFITLNYAGSLNASGQLSQVVDSSNFIFPSGGQWVFTICPNVPSAQCFTTVPLTITGTTQNVSTQINAILIAPRFTGVIVPYVYNDSEVNPKVSTVYINSANGALRYCYNGTCSNAGGGGSGTVTTFSTGSLSPLFTATVSNPTTTPALSFALTAAPANSVLCNSTAGVAVPAYAAACATSGANFTNLNGSNVATGTIPAARLPLGTTAAAGALQPDGTTITVTGGVITAVGGAAANPGGTAGSIQYNNGGAFGGASITGLVKGNGASAPTAATAGTDYLTPTGSGAGLTALNATNLSTGTVASARLPLGTIAAAGALQPDGTTITVTAGVITAVGGAAANPAGSAGSIQYNNAGVFGGVAVTGLLKGNGASAPTAATAGTDYLTPTGSGAGLTALNATNLSSGTVASARLPLGTTAAPGAVQADGTTITVTGGVITAVGGGTTNPAGTTGAIQYNNAGAFGGAAITGLLKGNGASAPTAATAGTDYLTPTGSGAGLTALNGSNISSGTVASARLPLGTTAAPGALQADGTTITVTGGVISAVGGAAANPAGTTGSIQYNNAGVFGGVAVTGLLKANGASAPTAATAGTDYLTPTGSGAGLTALNASNLSSGTVASARLPLGTTAAAGALQPDGTTITVTGGVISAVNSTTPGGTTGAIQYNNAGALGGASITGLMKGNGASAPTAATAGTDYVTPTGSGAGLTALNASNLSTGTVASARLPLGTTAAAGALRPDGTTITVNAGVISAVGGGSGNTTSTSLTSGTIPKANGANSIINSSLSDNGTTVTTTEPFNAPSYATTGTSNGTVALTSTGTLPSAAATSTIQVTAPNSVTAYTVELPGAQPTSGNTFLSCTAANPSVCTFTSASGGGITNTTTTVGTTAVAANTCNSTVTVTMTGVATTSTFTFTPNGDVSGVTGWGSNGGLTVDAWPTSNTLNYKVCNQTASSITPSASVTFNVSAK